MTSPVTMLVQTDGAEFTVMFGLTDTGEAPITLTLSASKLARGLNDITMLCAATGNVVTAGLRKHFEEHFAAGTQPQGGCGFCKLQGKVLAAEGRRRLNEREERGRVIPPGVTHSAATDAAKRAAEREVERVRRLPRLGNGRKGASDSDVWF